MTADPIQRLGASIEIYHSLPIRAPVRHAVFDFDGTLSLIRAGWQEVMTSHCVSELSKTPAREDRATLERICGDFILELTGHQTIYQMIRLADEVARRGGVASEPLEYKWQYLDHLRDKIAHRIADLERDADRAAYLVEGSIDLLDGLASRGAILYLASGTDEQFVIAETELLGLGPYFGDRVYGARDDYRSFSKKILLERIRAEHGVAGTALAVFGDGPVEIENAREVGGVGIGIASREDGGTGWDPWKRERLLTAGAHMLVPDWCESAQLLSFLCGESDG